MFTLARKFWPTQNYKLKLFRTKEIDLLYILETWGLVDDMLMTNEGNLSDRQTWKSP